MRYCLTNFINVQPTLFCHVIKLLVIGSFVLYVIKIGSNQLRSSCHVNHSRDTSVLLQYTTNNGVTWELLKVHRAEVYGTAKRVAIKLDEKVTDMAVALLSIRFVN